MKTYPAYFRKGTVCIKRESPTTGKQVEIPEPCRLHTVGFRFINTEDKAGFDKLVREMEPVSFEVYERYLTILHEFSKRQPASFRETHEFSPEFSGTSPRRM